MRNGPVLVIAEALVNTGHRLNLVEWFKNGAAKTHKFITKTDNPIWAKSMAIDAYIFVKWLAVLIFWVLGWGSLLPILLTSYLLWSNVFTYFYHHVWNPRHSDELSWQRRRFISLLQSIGFNVFGFAYLYRFSAIADFKWELPLQGLPLKDDLLSLMYSSLNLFGSGSTVASPASFWGLLLLTTQIVVTFIFLTLILSNTQISKESK